jgi:hypothetical protein
VIIFDPPSQQQGGRFMLLDSSRRLATELKAKEVAEFGQRLREWAAAQLDPQTKQPDPLLTFLADPKFQEKFDARTAQLTLSSRWMTYTAQLATPDDKTLVDQYRVFSDWYARLNTVLNLRSRPPFARLLLDEAIARHQAIPREVKLISFAKKGGAMQQTSVRIEYHLMPKLTQADLQAVAGVQRDLKAFKPVRFEEYRKRD